MSIAELMRLPAAGYGPRDPVHQVRLPGERRQRAVRSCAPAAGVTSLVPATRPCDGVRAAFARRAAPAFDARASPTSWIVAQDMIRRRGTAPDSFLEGRRQSMLDGAAPLVSDEGCDVRIGCRRVEGALRAALLTWLPLAHTDLALFEGGLLQGDPANAVALLLRPPTIWSLPEALLAERLFPRGAGFEPGRFASLERYAASRVKCRHVARLRAAVSRIEQQLPCRTLPAASAVVVAGCALVVADDDTCVAIAARQLARFATSALVAAEARRIENPNRAEALVLVAAQLPARTNGR